MSDKFYNPSSEKENIIRKDCFGVSKVNAHKETQSHLIVFIGLILLLATVSIISFPYLGKNQSMVLKKAKSK